MEIEEIYRETYGHDKRAINKHTVRTYRDDQGNHWILSRCLDGSPMFFEAYGPYRPGIQGLLPRFKIMGQDYWGDGWNWAQAERVFLSAVAVHVGNIQKEGEQNE